MKINQLDVIIGECIPNTLLEVEGESTLAAKLAPWIQDAKAWLESDYLGHDDFLSHEDNSRAVRIVVFKAFADAVPSLDLVVTPTGFGIVSTDSVAPASKDRIQRLLESLRAKINAELELLIECCHQYQYWRYSMPGKYFCTTFLSSLRDYDKKYFDSFDDMRSEAMRVESIMAEQCLGKSLMLRLRDEYNSSIPFAPHHLADAVHAAVKKIVYLPDSNPADPIIWLYCRPIVEILHDFPEYYDVWHQEMGEKFSHVQFKNDIKGSYFF